MGGCKAKGAPSFPSCSPHSCLHTALRPSSSEESEDKDCQCSYGGSGSWLSKQRASSGDIDLRMVLIYIVILDARIEFSHLAQAHSWVRMSEAEHEIETCVRKSMRNWITSGLEGLYVELYQMMQGQVAFGTRLRQGMAGDQALIDQRLRAKFIEIRGQGAAGQSSSCATETLSPVIFGNVKKHGGPTFETKSARIVDRACLIDLQTKMRQVLNHTGGLTAGPSSPSSSTPSLSSQPTHVGLINRITVSRAGEFTCPVRVGAILLASPVPPPPLGPGRGRRWLRIGAVGNSPVTPNLQLLVRRHKMSRWLRLPHGR